ncbi:uncharacterized protein LOC111311697 [Durio zibethinus]|uniref:Uncharacterized protein LOC111311697 n=1 Tax=Durio zibethinus TaxID=66656 RepID=A0A6P6AQE6_DURZI|nr:uncharacterized protein LOC111311697 [Durio zibethinus]
MQRSYTIDVAEDASALTEPSSFSSAEFLETSHVEGDTPGASLEERFMNMTDNKRDMVEAWLKENFPDITDDVDIPEASLEENIAASMDDGDIPEAWQPEYFIYGDNRDFVPLLDASFLSQVGFVPTQQPFKDCSTRKVSIPEWIFLIINVLIEFLSAAFDQLSSVNKPQYALIAMLMSFVAAMTCIIELAYKAGKERVAWRWESNLPWFYYSSPGHRRFGTFPEMIGLVCAMLQTILSAVTYSFYLQQADYPLKISFWPVVFALGLFCSKFM